MTAIIADLQVSSASLTYVTVPVAELLLAGNPTSDTVQMAFPAPGSEPTTFFNASWMTVNGIYYAQCLIGPGGTHQLAVGYYATYVKVVDNPQILFSQPDSWR